MGISPEVKDDSGNFKTIELWMLKKHMFFPLSSLSSFAVHTLLYPFVLVRTRLQLQEGSQVYKGLIHATRCIISEEGVRGLYNGYLTKCFQLVSGLAYVSTYEGVRGHLATITELSTSQRAFIGGASASLIAQSMVVPVDVVSQHLMLQSRPTRVVKSSRNRMELVRALTPVKLTEDEMASPWRRFQSVVRHVYTSHGLRGFYHGYLASLCTFVPSSAYWWGFYDRYCDMLSNNLPTEVTDRLPRLAIQLTAAPMAGVSSAVLINPIDCVRVRMQITNQTFMESVRQLWQHEGIRFVKKGLTARLAQSSMFSFWIILFYEPVKMISLKEEHKPYFGL